MARSDFHGLHVNAHGIINYADAISDSISYYRLSFFPFFFFVSLLERSLDLAFLGFYSFKSVSILCQ